ncbi:MAG: sigma-70 family RNA polymerase sigma factor [Chloroflexi bacterium]|nr:sigma-70 family RNA polymerase sigma factor [Chloroflexota bacterium]
MSDKDQALVRQTLAGHNEAFGVLVDRYSGLVYSLVLELVRRPEDVQDLVQEVFCKAYQQLSSLRRPASFPSWLARIAHNTALSWLRQEKSRHQVEVLSQHWILPASPPQPDRQAEENEHADLLWRCMDRLPAAQRRVVVLFYLEGCTYRELARFLGKSVATVRWYLFQAERRLGHELGLRLGEEQQKKSLDRRRLREKVLASLSIGMGAYSRSEALPWSPLERLLQLGRFSSQGLLAICFLGSALLHLLGMGALNYGWPSVEGPASGFSLILQEGPQAKARPVSSFIGEASGQPGPVQAPNSSPAVQRPSTSSPAAAQIPIGPPAPPLAQPWQPSPSASVLAEMAAQVARERPALPRLDDLGQADLSHASPPAVAVATSAFDSLSSQYERSGQFQAMVRYENPADPQSIQGFVHLGQIQSMRVNQAGASGAGTDTGEQLSQLDGLVHALETFTQIKADLAPSLTLADPRLLDLPIVAPLSLPNESEMEHLSRYLMEGGFVLSSGMPFEAFREGLEKYGHLVWGQEVWTEYLTESHPLFSAYFPLKGVPRTERTLTTEGTPAQKSGSPRLRQDRMLGLFVKGRLAGVEFYMPPRRVGRIEQYEDIAQSQLAVNIVVYALTQEGSLTRRWAPVLH